VRTNAAPWLAYFIALPLFGLVVAPAFGLFGAVTIEQFVSALQHETFKSALWLSLNTSFFSLIFIICLGTPTAWIIAGAPPRVRHRLVSLIELPIVMPPAVVGLGLLMCFGPTSLIGKALASLGLSIPFTTVAVIIAQVVIATPFYISAAVAAFSSVSGELILVARTLGLGRWATFNRVLIPMSLPHLISGAALAWARALGEFGATLLFAGSLKGVTMTMPLAIYSALETEIPVAITLALVLIILALSLLILLRCTPKLAKLLNVHANQENGNTP
jgi:molybdate transport system permease protein